MTSLPSVYFKSSDLKSCRGVSGPKHLGGHAGVRMCIRKRCRGVTCSPRSITKKHVERLYNLVSISECASFTSICNTKILSVTGLSNICLTRSGARARRPRRLQRYRVLVRDSLQLAQTPQSWKTSVAKSQ